MTDRPLNGGGKGVAAAPNGRGVASPVPSPSNAFLPGNGAEIGHARGGALDGMRLAVKDIYDVAGMVTGAGSPAWAAMGVVAQDHAHCVTDLLAAGAHFVGKTVSDELAFSLLGTNAHFPPPRNWAAPDRITGGSSSGSVAAVGAGEADIAIGSDTGGSIRAPASFCGLIGLRTTHGRVPMTGAVPLAPSFDTAGWFACSMAAYIATAAISLGASTPLENAGPGPRLLRCRKLDDLLDPDERSALDEIADRIARTLGTAGPASLALGEEPERLYRCFRVLQAAEAWTMHGAFVTQHGDAMNPDVRERFAFGRDLSECELGDAIRLRAALAAWLADELGDDGVLVLPTVPGPAPRLASEQSEMGSFRERALHLLCVSGLTGMPQLTLPLGEIGGAPFGVSLLGPRGSDHHLPRLGATIMERAGREQRVAGASVGTPLPVTAL